MRILIANISFIYMHLDTVVNNIIYTILFACNRYLQALLIAGNLRPSIQAFSHELELTVLSYFNYRSI